MLQYSASFFNLHRLIHVQDLTNKVKVITLEGPKVLNEKAPGQDLWMRTHRQIT